jgi:rhamnulokinase
LNQFVADACQRPVVTGPVEATAMGNLLTQVRTNGELGSLVEMREVVRNSNDEKRYDPKSTGVWTEAVGRFTELREKK